MEKQLDDKNNEIIGRTDRCVSVPSDCHAIYRVVDPNETCEAQMGLRNALYHIPSFPSLETINSSEKLYEKRNEMDADLVELLLCLDWKINLLIKTVAPTHDETFYPNRAVILEMSLGGMKIQTPTSHRIGEIVELHFVLPILPFKELFLKGEIESQSSVNLKEYSLVMYSNLLKESDREHIIRYVVRRQFQIKRDRRMK
ncbi:MAG: PilZ domain-containing protein [Nitrospirota bacterium]